MKTFDDVNFNAEELSMNIELSDYIEGRVIKAAKEVTNLLNSELTMIDFSYSDSMNNLIKFSTVFDTIIKSDDLKESSKNITKDVGIGSLARSIMMGRFKKTFNFPIEDIDNVGELYFFKFVNLELDKRIILYSHNGIPAVNFIITIDIFASLNRS